MRPGRDGGFTIVELLIVIVIIGILVGIVVSNFIGAQNRAKTAAVQHLAAQIVKKAKIYEAEYGEYPTYEAMMALPDDDPAKLGSNLHIIPPTDDEGFISAQSADSGRVVMWGESVNSWCGEVTGASAFVVYWDYVKNTQIAVPISDGSPAGNMGTDYLPIGHISSCAG